MKKSWLLLLIPVLLIAWWIFNAGPSKATVHFTPVAKVTIESTVSTNGKVQPAESATARAETAGTVRSISVARGENVSAGQPLISLDTAGAEADLAAAVAREQEARSDLSTLSQGGRASAVADIDAAVTSAQSAVEVAQRNYDALQRLAAQEAATKLQVQQAHDELVRAQEQLAAAQVRKKTLVTGSDRTIAAARLRDSEAAVQLAQHHLAITTVAAPIGGTVFQFDLKVGDYLQPGQLVAEIGQIDRMKVTVYVDEPDLGRVAPGMPVKITWDAKPGQSWWGKVDKMPTEVVALGTRTVGEVQTIVDNPNHELLPNVTVNATLVSKVVQDATAIPKGALHTRNGVSGVFRLEGDRLKWAPVTTGVSDINNVEITSGLQVGDRVADRVVSPTDAELKDAVRVTAQD